MNPQGAASDLAGRFGLRKRARSWVGDCPSCSYRAAFSIKAGRNGIPFLYCANGCTRYQLQNTASQALGSAWKPSPAPASELTATAQALKAAAAERLWNGSTPCGGTPAARYLERRGIGHASRSASLRFRGDCGHPEGGRHPALIARVQDAVGKPIAVHRTYLTPNGRKATLDPPKASLGPVWGGAIRLHPVAPWLVIAEGIETAASAGVLLRLPAWAALSAGNLKAGMMLPPEVASVTIAADRDGPGLQAAQEAARRWRAEGRKVQVMAPDGPGQDFNDLLLCRTGLTHAE